MREGGMAIKSLIKQSVTISIGILVLGYSAISFAQSAEPDYFLDHVPVGPGKSLSVTYTFPTPQHIIECNQDVPSSRLGSLEWKYKGTSFKGQIGDRRYFTLESENAPPFGKGQTADITGTLIFTNLDDSRDLFISCHYDIKQ